MYSWPFWFLRNYKVYVKYFLTEILGPRSILDSRFFSDFEIFAYTMDILGRNPRLNMTFYVPYMPYTQSVSNFIQYFSAFAF